MGYIPLGYAKNMCRIQVAEAFLNRLSKKTKASSAGTEPVEYIDPKAVEVMRESASK
jgi:protein-tyrosine-phosphatase